MMRRPSNSPRLAVILAALAVTIRFGGGSQVHRVKTDEEGRYRLEVPGTGSHEMSFTLGGRIRGEALVLDSAKERSG